MNLGLEKIIELLKRNKIELYAHKDFIYLIIDGKRIDEEQFVGLYFPNGKIL